MAKLTNAESRTAFRVSTLFGIRTVLYLFLQCKTELQYCTRNNIFFNFIQNFTEHFSVIVTPVANEIIDQAFALAVLKNIHVCVCN